MIDAKRIAYLLFLTMLIGVALVHLRTLHVQNVYQMTSLLEEEQHVRQTLAEQQVLLTGQLQSPESIRGRIERSNLAVAPIQVRPTLVVSGRTLKSR